jgi:hypothetical protein
LEGDETATVSYEVTLSAESEDHNYLVEGKITIKNPVDNPTASVDSIVDELNASGDVEVVCPAEFDFELAADEAVTCDYSQSVANMDDTLNTVTVDAVIGGLDLQTVATANVEWSEEPTLEIDECVTLSDTNAKFGEKYNVDDEVKVCASELDESGTKTFSYNVVFGEDVSLVCGGDDYDNTAAVLSQRLDEQEEPIMLDQDSWTVAYNYLCPVAACSFSQGYWFAKPNVEWPGSVNIGGHDYDQAAGSLVWNSSNQGGKTDAKKAFLQLATVLLSFHPDELPAALQDYQNTINDFLADYEEVTGNNIDEKDKAVSDAADAISTWIGENHCADDDYADLDS